MIQQTLTPEIQSILEAEPILVGRSKKVYAVSKEVCLVKLLPSLSSFTFNRHEDIEGTEILRLDFFELAVQQLRSAGISVAFQERVGPDIYLAELCTNPPFEVIVKNVAVGSTIRKYPGLFPEGHHFEMPVVKFDFRIDPEDQPIADDYLREAGFQSEEFKKIALRVNEILRNWLAPRELLDFCVIIGQRKDGSYSVISEISPDGMRLRSPDNTSLDKDLFRHGSNGQEIVAVWSDLIESLKG